MFKILIHKTEDIIFEIHLKEKIFILHRIVEDEEREISFPLTALTPENLLKHNIIKEEVISFYNEIYNSILSGKNIEKKNIELNVDNRWKWYRLYSIAVNSDNIVGILEDFTDEKVQELEIIKINEKSKYDFLTNVYNREGFEREFKNFLEKNSSSNGINALFLIDLDNFKNINDILGHDIGDTVLKEVGKILKNCIRKNDFAGRLGGDEFTLLVQNVKDIDALHDIAERLNSSLIKTYKKADDDSIEITVSASIGISILEENSTFETAYKKADTALYCIKYNGRNSYFIN